MNCVGGICPSDKELQTVPAWQIQSVYQHLDIPRKLALLLYFQYQPAV